MAHKSTAERVHDGAGKPPRGRWQWCIKTTARRGHDGARIPKLSGHTMVRENHWVAGERWCGRITDIRTMVLEDQDQARARRLCWKTTARWVSDVGLEAGDGAVKP